MTYRYYITFRDKTEYVKHNNRFVQYPIGALMLSVLEYDWQALAEEISAMRRNAYRMDQVQAGMQALRVQFSSAHVFLQRDFERLSKSGDALYSAYQWAASYARFVPILRRLIEQALDLDGENNTLSTVQRYFLVNHNDLEARRFKQMMHEQLKVFQCMLTDAAVTDGLLQAQDIAGAHVDAAICYAGDELRTLVFMEWEYMVTMGYGIRRCANCGRYFLPFSVSTRYCDRIYSGDKTCKDVAVRERYKKKLSQSAVRTLYVKNNNAYQMRVHRAPGSYTQQDYLSWKQQAREALEACERGEMSERDCLDRLALPGRA